MRWMLALLLILLPLVARAETCQFDAPGAYSCSNVTTCSVSPTGCTLSADDFWDVGDGVVEQQQIVLSATGGTFTLTFEGGITTPAIAYNSTENEYPRARPCASGGHRLGWAIEARDEREALGHLPPFVAERTEVAMVGKVLIP